MAQQTAILGTTLVLGASPFRLLPRNVLVRTVLERLVVRQRIGEGRLLLAARQPVLLAVEVAVHHHAELHRHPSLQTKPRIPWEVSS